MRVVRISEPSPTRQHTSESFAVKGGTWFTCSGGLAVVRGGEQVEYSKWLNEKINESLGGQDMVCKNCKFNFSGICAAHDSHWGYGGEIEHELESCYAWDMSLDFFVDRAKRIEGKGR